jgi:uncharacterized protein (TIGR02466 family)
MVDKVKVELLFPTPVAIFDKGDFFKNEHPELINANYLNHLDGGLLTEDKFILDQHTPNLKTWILNCIQQYALESLAISDELGITQSWCIKHTTSSQTLFSHMHPNSIISGAYYVHAPEGSEPLRIHKPKQSGGTVVNWDQPEHVTYNKPWTWSWMNFKAQTGRLILFPSYMYHSVEGFNHNNNNNGRCVLSFNSWFKGPFGKSDQLYKLNTILN